MPPRFATTGTWANLQCVANFDELVNAARRLADDIVGLASEMLGAGIDAKRVHRRYVTAAFELSEEIEARAVLAAAGDEDAVRRLELLVRELRRLSEEAVVELDDQRGGEGEV